VHYVLADQQGSVASFNSASGTTELKESFGAYGSPRDPTTWSGTMSTADQTTQNAISLHGYTFHTMLAASGLIHMNGRVQDALTGRFLSADPYTSEPGNTQGYNRYAYVKNNPMTFVDPSGFYEVCFDQSFTASHVEYYNVSITLYAWKTRVCNTIPDPSPSYPHTPPGTPGGGQDNGGGDDGSDDGGGGDGGTNDPPQDEVVVTGLKPQKPSTCVNYIQLVAGGAATALGGWQAVEGFAESLLGLGLAPQTAGSSLLLSAKGAGTMVVGGIAVMDGLKLMDTALDGQVRSSTLSTIGNRAAGSNGAEAGDVANLALGVRDLAQVANGRSRGAMAMNLMNFMASTVLPETMMPCQVQQ
jgi:RHS repeat-associated protein